jgi:hypothetical protein
VTHERTPQLPLHVKIFGGKRQLIACAESVSDGDVELYNKLVEKCVTDMKWLKPQPAAIAIFVVFSLLTGFMFTLVSLIVFAVARHGENENLKKWKAGHPLDKSCPLLAHIHSIVINENEKILEGKYMLAAEKAIEKFEETKNAQGNGGDSGMFKAFIELLELKTRRELDRLGIKNRDFIVEDGTTKFSIREFFLFNICAAATGNHGGYDISAIKCGSSADIPVILDTLYCNCPDDKKKERNLAKPIFSGALPTRDVWNEGIEHIALAAIELEEIFKIPKQEDDGDVQLSDEVKEDIRSKIIEWLGRPPVSMANMEH